MRGLIVAAGVALFSSCSGPCRLVGCAGAVDLKLVDAAGTVVRGVRGTVSVMGETPETIDCPGSSNGLWLCTVDGLRLSRLNGVTGPIEVDLRAGSLSFKGTVTPTYSTVTQKDFNGPGCDCSAEIGVATVTLR
jgi:hypothetical protein